MQKQQCNLWRPVAALPRSQHEGDGSRRKRGNGEAPRSRRVEKGGTRGGAGAPGKPVPVAEHLGRSRRLVLPLSRCRAGCAPKGRVSVPFPSPPSSPSRQRPQSPSLAHTKAKCPPSSKAAVVAAATIPALLRFYRRAVPPQTPSAAATHNPQTAPLCLPSALVPPTPMLSTPRGAMQDCSGGGQGRKPPQLTWWPLFLPLCSTVVRRRWPAYTCLRGWPGPGHAAAGRGMTEGAAKGRREEGRQKRYRIT